MKRWAWRAFGMLGWVLLVLKLVTEADRSAEIGRRVQEKLEEGVAAREDEHAEEERLALESLLRRIRDGDQGASTDLLFALKDGDDPVIEVLVKELLRIGEAVVEPGTGYDWRVFTLLNRRWRSFDNRNYFYGLLWLAGAPPDVGNRPPP